jgi:hypothetical protein
MEQSMSLQFEMPQVGSKIRVTTKFKNHVLYNPSEYTETTYVGTVGSAHKLLSPNSFVLNTPNTPHFSKREINLAYVTRLEYEDGTIANKKANTDQIWTVKGSKGDIYTVKRTDNKLICNCVGFQFRNKCKHISMVK